MAHLVSRILMTADTIGGVWTYALDLCRALGAHGVEVMLATMGNAPSAGQRAQAAGLGNVALRESTFKLEWMNAPWQDVRAAGEWLLDLQRSFRPDVVHLNGYAHGSLPWSAPAVVVVAHSCVCSWWQACKGEAAPTDWNPYRRAVARGMRGADLVVAPSRAMRAALVQHYGSIRHAIVISNGRRDGLFRPIVKEPIVFSAGRLWDEAKNVAALCDAAAGVPWPVCIAGEAADPQGGAASKLKNVRPLGRLSEANIADWLGRASIYALPARYEPFGLSALEAAMSRCALVLGDIDSLREVWDDAAVYVPPDRPGSLRDAIGRLTESPRSLQSMAERACARARHYTAARMGDAYLAAYRSVVRYPARARAGGHRSIDVLTPSTIGDHAA
jgi:glycogen synthase